MGVVLCCFKAIVTPKWLVLKHADYGQILAQDAASEVALITCEDDVIVRCRYNAIYIETMNNKQYMHILDKMQVPRRRYLLQAKDTFDCKH